MGAPTRTQNQYLLTKDDDTKPKRLRIVCTGHFRKAMVRMSPSTYLPFDPARTALVEDRHGSIDITVEDGAQIYLSAAPMDNLWEVPCTYPL